MAYSHFKTLVIVKDAFNRVFRKGVGFFPELAPLVASQILMNYLEYSLCDKSVALNDIYDFLLSRSPILIRIAAPLFILVETKNSDLGLEFGKCAAKIMAAKRFHIMKNKPIETMYGAVRNGT